MKKLCTVLICMVLVCSITFAQEVEKKVWNNGEIDYVPLETKIRLEANDFIPESGAIFYSYNFGDIEEYTAPIVLNEEGDVTVTYATQDVFYQVDNLQCYRAIVDGTAPVAKYTINGPSYVDNNGVFYFTSNTGIYIYGEDKYSGTEHIWARLAEGDFTDYQENHDVYLYDAEDGEYYIEGYLVDHVGNSSEMIAAFAYLDNTAPTVKVNIEPAPIEINGVQYVDPKARFTLSAEDALSGVDGIYLALDNADYARYEVDTMINQPGEHILNVYAVDNLGNKGEAIQVTFNNNLKLPSIDLLLEIEGKDETVITGTTEVYEDTGSQEQAAPDTFEDEVIADEEEVEIIE